VGALPDRHLVGELAIVTGWRQTDLTDVEVQVEVLVLDPVGEVQAEGNTYELLRERRQEVDPLADETADVTLSPRRRPCARSTGGR
jgi:hypothetical protein